MQLPMDLSVNGATPNDKAALKDGLILGIYTTIKSSFNIFSHSL